MWSVGIDVGGTFTDLFAYNADTAQTVTAKVLTTKHDRSEGVIKAIEQADLPFNGIDKLVHGSTTATNALVERDYPRTAVITTEGFRDTIEIGRMRRKRLFDPYQQRPEPLVPRRLRFTVPGRLDAQGAELAPFDDAAARALARRLGELDVVSVAVGFINSYKNPSHEERMRDILKETCPDLFVSLSAETVRKVREHARFTTNVIRAAVLPVMQRYFDALTSRLGKRGFVGTLLVLKSNGGSMGVDVARERPEELIESGPAGGVAYGRYLAEFADFPNIIHTDMGGTTFDASIVENGMGLITHDYELEWETPVSIPMLDIRSVGAGGGSIAWIDPGGSLRVGPQSAGSEPGPACYGRGGTRATVTDANLLLGRLEPTLNGKLALDKGAAETAVQKIADQLGMDLLDTAEGIIRITCENMAQAIKMVLVDRGRDPRDFILASFGGAGAMHAAFIAQAMNIPRVLVPGHAGVASAFGAVAMDIRHDLEAFYYAPVESADFREIERLFGNLEKRARDLMRRDGIADAEIAVNRTAQMRYVGQSWEVTTPLAPDVISAADARDRITRQFHREHELEHGVFSEAFSPEFISIGITAIGQLPKPRLAPVPGGSDGVPTKGSRDVYFDGVWTTTAVLDGQALAAGQKVGGPAIIEYDHSCSVLPPGAVSEVDAHGNLIVAVNL